MKMPTNPRWTLSTIAAGVAIAIATFIGGLAAAVLISGCSTSPALNGSAETQSQSAALLEDIRVARAYASLAAVRKSAARLLDSGRIKVEDAERVQASADAVRLALDTARAALRAGREGNYQLAIAQAMQLLASLETYIQERSK